MRVYEDEEVCVFAVIEEVSERVSEEIASHRDIVPA